MGQEHSGLAVLPQRLGSACWNTDPGPRDHGRCEAAVQHLHSSGQWQHSGDLGWTRLGLSHECLTHSLETRQRGLRMGAGVASP